MNSKLINKNVPVAKKMKENMQMVDSFHHIMQKNENENFGGLYLASNCPLLGLAISVADPAVHLGIRHQAQRMSQSQNHSACALIEMLRART